MDAWCEERRGGMILRFRSSAERKFGKFHIRRTYGILVIFGRANSFTFRTFLHFENGAFQCSRFLIAFKAADVVSAKAVADGRWKMSKSRKQQEKMSKMNFAEAERMKKVNLFPGKAKIDFLRLLSSTTHARNFNVMAKGAKAVRALSEIIS